LRPWPSRCRDIGFHRSPSFVGRERPTGEYGGCHRSGQVLDGWSRLDQTSDYHAKQPRHELAVSGQISWTKLCRHSSVPASDVVSSPSGNRTAHLGLLWGSRSRADARLGEAAGLIQGRWTEWNWPSHSWSPSWLGHLDSPQHTTSRWQVRGVFSLFADWWER
jgi:hypothetical protein